MRAGSACARFGSQFCIAAAAADLFARTAHHHAEEGNHCLMTKETYRCWAEIDRGALRHNAKVVRERIGSAEMLAVVKANAYGHGLMGVAETLAEQAQLFGVANLEEAMALRERFHLPVIILGPSLPEELPTIVERGFIPTVSTFQE